MIASLGMYDPPWLRAANDALWQALAERLAHMGISDVPSSLTRDRPLPEIWTAPDLLLAQTCGYPLMTSLGESVVPVATPIHDAPGCDGPRHGSMVIVRRGDPAGTLDDLRGRRAAINSRDSNTGMNLFRAVLAPFAQGAGLFTRVLETGAHARSLAAVIAGKADVASIDAVTFALLRDRFPGVDRRVRILARTPVTPGLPLVTASSTPAGTVAALRRALGDLIDDPALAPTLRALRLTGFAILDRRDYEAVTDLEKSAFLAGYPTLC